MAVHPVILLLRAVRLRRLAGLLPDSPDPKNLPDIPAAAVKSLRHEDPDNSKQQSFDNFHNNSPRLSPIRY